MPDLPLLESIRKSSTPRELLGRLGLGSPASNKSSSGSLAKALAAVALLFVALICPFGMLLVWLCLSKHEKGR